MNYDEMSDYKINRKVARLIFGSDSIIRRCLASRSSAIIHGRSGEFDPCSNPSDAWPLLLSLLGGGCTIVIEKNSFNGSDLNGKSITRKIAELYLSFNPN